MTNRADLQIVYRNPADLVPTENNPRDHSEEQIRLIRRSMEEFSNYNPILLREDDKTVGAGHGRRLASLLPPAMERVPTITLRGLTDEQWRALIIADNRIALGSTWNNDLLKLELDGLKAEGFDLSLTGFSSLEISGLFSTPEGYTHPDEVPDEAPGPSVTREGDLWRLEAHWLGCGDSTDAATVERVLGGITPVLCVSDQPYGTNYVSSRRAEHLNDGFKRATADVKNDHRSDWREAWALFPGDVIYVWHNPLVAGTVQASLEASNFALRAQIIWRKVQPVIGPPNSQYRWQHEAAYMAVRKGRNANWQGSRKESTVWEADRPKRTAGKDGTGHATEKPVELWRKAIENHTEAGDHVFDPFCGSGVCIIAAQMTKRVAHCVEIDPHHVDRTLVRFAQFTGIQPILAETGETFEQVRERRVSE